MHQGPPTNFGNSQPGNPTFFSPFANNLNAQTNTNVGGPPTFTNPTGFPQQVPFTPTPVGPPPVYNPTTSAPPVYNPTVSSPPPVYNPNPTPAWNAAPVGPIHTPAYNPNQQFANPVSSPPPTYQPEQTAPPPVYNPNAPNPNVGTTAPPPVNYSPLSSISTGANPNTQTSPVGRYPPPVSNMPPQQVGGNQPMKSPRGNEQKINPNQIPSPTNMDPNTLISYNTRSNVAPPPVTVPFTVVDDGNASPRFMRMTLYNIPTTTDIYKNCNAPLGFALQPLAELGPNEEPVPLVNFGPSGPIRCIRCKAYINPFVIWSNGGRQYQCRLCDVVNDVPKEYFSPIEPSGKRYDHNSRPELSKGVVDFVASAEYIEKPPVAMSYLFAIDVSYSSVSSGLLQLIINSLRRVLNEFPMDNKIGIMTFDSTVHFYNLNPSLQNPQMLVVPDIDSVFLPLSEEVIFVKYSDCKSNIDTLLDKLPQMFANSKVNDSSFGSAIEAATIAMKSNGGRVIAFQSVLPNIGQGRLVKRDDLKAYGTDKERILYTPSEGFYTTKVKEIVKNKVSVDVFLCPPVGFVDVGTIGNLSRQTGGHVYFYPNFNVMKDGEKVQMDLIRNMTRESGYDGLLRVRTGRGLGVVTHHGNFSTSNQIELELSGIHSETSIYVELKHEEKLDEKQEVCIQTALLYTTSQGERRIRVFNMSLPVTSVLGNVFRNADLDAIMNYYAKSCISEVQKTPMTTLRSNIVERIVDVLYSYRKFCATSSSPGQLILPEALKLLPVFTLSLLKNPMMRPGTDVHPDERNYYLYLLYSLPPALSTPLLYPRMYALHTMSNEAGTTDSRGNIKLPPLVRLSSDLLSQDSAFLLEDGQRMLLWIGKSLSFANEFLHQDSYSSSISLLPPNYEQPEQFITRLHNIINSIRQSHRSFEPLNIIKQGEVGEMKFFTYLVEDKGLDTMNYVDFLCHVHRQIQGKL